MSESDLRERVARAIEATIRYAVEPDVRANEMTPDELAMLADAAIAICMEEAARALKQHYDYHRAEAHRLQELSIKYKDDPSWASLALGQASRADGWQAADAAIRALATASAPKPQSDG